MGLHWATLTDLDEVVLFNTVTSFPIQYSDSAVIYACICERLPSKKVIQVDSLIFAGFLLDAAYTKTKNCGLKISSKGTIGG